MLCLEENSQPPEQYCGGKSKEEMILQVFAKIPLEDIKVLHVCHIRIAFLCQIDCPMDY